MATVTASTSQAVPHGDPNFQRAFQAFSDKASSILESPFLGVLSFPLNAGAGAIAATLFTSITPLGGALYGLADLATTNALAWLGNKLGDSAGWRESTLFKVVNYVLPRIVGIGAGIGAVALAGAVLTPGTVVALAVGTAAFGALLAMPIAAVVIGIAAYDGYQAYSNPPTGSSY